jgi:hypothetical protein
MKTDQYVADRASSIFYSKETHKPYTSFGEIEEEAWGSLTGAVSIKKEMYASLEKDLWASLDYRIPTKEKDKDRGVKNLGKTRGFIFCMAYLFTKSKTELVCGSMDNINKYGNSFPICHGMVHVYQDKKIVNKSWYVFSQSNKFFLEYVRSGEKCIPYNLVKFLDPCPKQSKYYLVLSDHEKRKYDVLASWRKMPSTYIKEFDDMLEDLDAETLDKETVGMF